MAKVSCACLKLWLRPFSQVEAEFSPWELGLSEEAVHTLIQIVGMCVCVCVYVRVCVYNIER